MTAKVNFEVEDDSVLEQIVAILGTFSSVHNVHVANALDDEISLRVKHYQNDTSTAIAFDANLDKMREKIASQI